MPGPSGQSSRFLAERLSRRFSELVRSAGCSFCLFRCAIWFRNHRDAAIGNESLQDRAMSFGLIDQGLWKLTSRVQAMRSHRSPFARVFVGAQTSGGWKSLFDARHASRSAILLKRPIILRYSSKVESRRGYQDLARARVILLFLNKNLANTACRIRGISNSG